MTSFVIVNFNGGPLTCRAVASIRTYEPGNEIIVVDNGSTDGSLERIRKECPGIVLIEAGRNLGFGCANNMGAAHATGENVFFLNNDAYLTAPILGILRTAVESVGGAGAFGPRIVYDDGTFQVSIGKDPSILNERTTAKLQRQEQSAESLIHKGKPVEVDWVTGAALVVRADLFRAIGGFDERYFMYFEDADLCRRIRDKGEKVMYVPDCTLSHSKGRSGGSRDVRVMLEYRRSQLLYYDSHCSPISRSLLRIFLMGKGLVRMISPEDHPDMRQFGRNLMRLAAPGRGKH